MLFRPMPVLSVLSALSLGILIMLGNWQYARYAEKSGAGPVASTAPDIAQIEAEFFGPEDLFAQQVYGVIDGEPVWRRYAPARIRGEDGWVLALRGISGGPVAQQVKLGDGPTRYEAQSMLRPPSSYVSSRFSNQNQPAQNQWYAMDLDGISERLGMPELPRYVVEPVVITIQNADDPRRVRETANPYAYETPPDPLPPERHFGYALTWWGMAIGLAGVYLAFHHARGRLRFRS